MHHVLHFALTQGQQRGPLACAAQQMAWFAAGVLVTVLLQATLLFILLRRARRVGVGLDSRARRGV